MQASCRPEDPSKYPRGSYIHTATEETLKGAWEKLQEETGATLVAIPSGDVCRLCCDSICFLQSKAENHSKHGYAESRVAPLHRHQYYLYIQMQQHTCSCPNLTSLPADRELFGRPDSELQKIWYLQCTAEQQRYIDQVSLPHMFQASSSHAPASLLYLNTAR